jgi:phosphoribosylaminoimidazole (AIR) synthetase
MTHIPYSKFELSLALISASELIEAKQEEIRQKLETIVKVEPENKMKAVADFTGISLNDLINSPNMDKLVKRFDDYNLNQVVTILKEAGLSDKEAWAVFIYMYEPKLLDMEY